MEGPIASRAIDSRAPDSASVGERKREWDGRTYKRRRAEGPISPVASRRVLASARPRGPGEKKKKRSAKRGCETSRAIVVDRPSPSVGARARARVCGWQVAHEVTEVSPRRTSDAREERTTTTYDDEARMTMTTTML